MSDLVLRPAIQAMSAEAIDNVRALERDRLQWPQIPIAIDHVIHGEPIRAYYRTMFIPFVPPGVLVTGVLVKVPTTLIIHGDVTVYLGDSEMRWRGHNVVPASGGRKQAFVAHADTYVTMTFPTMARTVEEAEREFTDETDLLASRRDGLNSILITGDRACLE